MEDALVIYKDLRIPVTCAAFIFLHVINASPAFSTHRDDQQCKVEVVVVDAHNHTLTGVAVEVLGTKVGGITNVKGSVRFSLNQGETYKIRASYIGFESVEQTIKVPVQDRLSLTLKMVESTTRLSEVIVVGEGDISEIKAREPYSVEVIDLEQIRNQPKEMVRIINQIPGVRIRQDGSLGSTSNIMLNGIDGKGVRIFVDDIPVHLLGSTYSINNISPGIIDRIEVYNGAIPVKFGTDALGGVINLITSSINNDFFEVGYSYGSWNTNEASVKLRKNLTKSKKIFTEIDGFYINTDNDYWMDDVEVPVDENFNTEPGRARRFNDQYRSILGRAKLGIQDLTWADELVFMSSVSHVRKEWQHGVLADLPWGEPFSEQEVWNAMVSYKKADKIDKWDLNLAIGYANDKVVTIDTASRTYFWNQVVREKVNKGESDLFSNGTTPEFTSNSLFGRASLNYAIQPHHTLNLTLLTYRNQLQARNGALREADRMNLEQPQNRLSSYAGFAMESKLLDGKLTNIASIKHHYTRVTGVENFTQGFVGEDVINSFSLVGYGNVLKYWMTNSLSVNLGYEFTVRQPENEEIFGDFFRVRSNPNLNPERSQNLNFGADYFLDNPNINIGVSFFYRDTKDRIFLIATPFTSAFDNLVGTDAIGTVLNVTFETLKNISIQLNATYQNIRLQEADASGVIRPRFVGLRVPNIPHLFGNVLMSYSLESLFVKKDKITFSTHLNYVQQFFLNWSEEGLASTKDVIPTQWIQDLGCSWIAPNNKWSLGFECRNLWNTKAFDNYSVQKPGRSYYVQTRIFFGSNTQ